MKYFIGIDGGGSKTKFALCDEQGHIRAECVLSGSSYRELGADEVCGLLRQGVGKVCEGIGLGSVSGVCFGMPCYGEHGEEDALAARKIEQALAPLPVCFQNDVAAAWAGTLALQSGIIILAGTGSMAWGRDRHGAMKRCGGWSEFFSDEGSGYWLGKKTLELFSKQADGREPKGKLYEIVRTHFALRDDFDVIGRLDAQGYSRKSVAALQLLLEKAALAGDESALRLYGEAAHELALMVKALRSGMDLAPNSPVSYAGGLWGAGALILRPFLEAIKDLDMTPAEPLLTPVDGAILFAAERFDSAALPRVKQGLLEHRGL